MLFTRKLLLFCVYTVTELPPSCQKLSNADFMQRPVRRCTKEPAKFILQYPTIAVHGTPESWISHSQLITMTSNHDDGSFEDTTSSLGDSSYDFIDDRSLATSDDEETRSAMTQSTSSDEHYNYQNNTHSQDPSAPSNNIGVGQLSNISLDSVSVDRENPLQSESQVTDRAIGPHDDCTIKDSLHNGQSKGQEEDTHSFIKLREATQPDSQGIIDGSDPLRAYRGSNTAQVWPTNSPNCSSEKITVEIEQTLLSQGLLLEKPYKVLYVGDHEVKDLIIQKVGAALAATPRIDEVRPSKFSIVPISSFGDTASPDVVLIDSSGLELIVDECTSATFVSGDEGNDTICMTLSDGMLVQSSWSGSNFRVSGHWTLPHVAIFYLSSKNTILAKQTERFARAFMNRHSVPAIVISDLEFEKSGTGTNAIDIRTPHLLLESCGPFPSTEYLPINLPTFLHLDAGQLSRNLLYLAHDATSATTIRGSDTVNKIDRGGGRALAETDRQFDGMIDGFCKFLPMTVVLLLSTLLFHLIMSNTIRQYWTSEPNSHWGMPIQAITTLSLTSPQPTSIVPTSALSHYSVASNGVTSLSQPVQIPKGISTVHENTDITSYLASFLTEGHSPSTNNSDKFKVHVIGDRHIVLRPPYWFTRARKAPKLLFKITRDGTILEHEVSPLFDGVYALKLRRADAYGVLSVSVWTTSKPKIHENFQVALKSSWLNMGGWKKFAGGMISGVWGDLSSIRSDLVVSCTHTSNGFRSLLQSTFIKAANCQKGAARLKAASHQFSEKWQNRSNTVTGHISQHMQRLGRKLAFCVDNRRAMILEHAASVTWKIKAAADKVSRLRENHLRRTQKGVLKAWWSVRGLPLQRSGRETEGTLRKHTVGVKSRISR